MAEYVELYIDQGSDFSTTVKINDDNTNMPVNIQSYIVTSSLRRSLLSPNVSSNLVCYITDAGGGEIELQMSAADSSNLRPGTYFFDVRTTDVVNNSFHSRLIEEIGRAHV